MAVKSASCEFVGEGDGLLGGADGVEAFGLGLVVHRGAVRGLVGPVGENPAALHLRGAVEFHQFHRDLVDSAVVALGLVGVLEREPKFFQLVEFFEPLLLQRAGMNPNVEASGRECSVRVLGPSGPPLGAVLPVAPLFLLSLGEHVAVELAHGEFDVSVPVMPRDIRDHPSAHEVVSYVLANECLPVL